MGDYLYIKTGNVTVNVATAYFMGDPICLN